MFPAAILSLFFLLTGLWFLFLKLHSRNPENRRTAVGTLTRHNTRRNVPTKFGLVPLVTSYTYTYSVGGKAYQLKGDTGHTKNHLAKKVTIVYLKACPRCAWIDRYPGTMYGVTALICLAAGIFMAILVGFAVA